MCGRSIGVGEEHWGVRVGGGKEEHWDVEEHCGVRGGGGWHK